MKANPDQLAFDFAPRPGEIWTVHYEIVMVVRVGSSDAYKFMPNCIEYIGLGYAVYDGCGRWWEVDYSRPSENPDPYWAPTGTMRCDKTYFLPWDGRGVFYATGDGQKAADLITEWRKATHWGRPGRDEIEDRLKKLFGRQVANDGFK